MDENLGLDNAADLILKVEQLEVENARLKAQLEPRGEAYKSIEEDYNSVIQIIENVNEYILISDREGFPVLFNAAYASVMKEAFGIEMKPGLKPHTLIPDSDVVAWWDNLHRRVLNGERFSVEYSHTFGQRDLRYFEIRYSPIVKEGEILGFTEFTRDITSRKKAEQDLRESEERYRNLVESSPVGILVHCEGILEFVNSEAVKLLAADSAEELLGKKVLDLIPGEDHNFAKKRIERIYKGREAVEMVLETFIRMDGKRIDVEVMGTPVNYRSKPASQAVFRDVSQRIAAEKDLRESEERFSVAFRTNPDAIAIIRLKDGITIDVNEGFTAHTGYTETDIVGKDILELGIFQLADAPSELRAKLKKGEQLSNVEVTVRRKKDSLCFGLLSSKTLKLKGEDHILVISRDITAIKEAEEERKKLEQQLLQAKKMEAIGTLAGGLAHDFNNLLMGIQGRLSMMMADTESASPFMNHLRGIQYYIKSATSLTRQMLGIAKRGKYEVKATNLNEMLDHQTELFGRTTKGIVFHKKAARDLWAAETDQDQMQQVILNLFVNAWQAMPDGGDIFWETKNVTIDAECAGQQQVEPGKFICFSITDTGTGMDVETIKRIFDPFFTTKSMSRGTGLGLASVYGIVKNHGGFVSVESRVGKGSQFTVFLPAVDKEVVIKEAPVKEIRRGCETILVVDDEVFVVEVVCEMLESLGYSVLAAEDGRTGVEIYKERKKSIALVILDVIMPHMGGKETLELLKTVNPAVKVLLASGYSLEGQAKELLENGCKGFMQKPFQLNELSQKIREILDSPD